MNKKKLKEYLEKYGSVPKDAEERMGTLLEQIKLSEKDLYKIKKHIKHILNMKWNRLDFVFYFIPEGSPRPRQAGRTRHFYVKDAKDNSDIFKQFMEEWGEFEGLIVTPVRLVCDMFMPIPSGMTKVERVISELGLTPAVSKPDWDNAGKTYSDMIQNHLILDDCLIYDGRVRKFYSHKPRIEIHIEFMNSFDCNYNKKKVESWKLYKDNIDRIIEYPGIIDRDGETS